MTQIDFLKNRQTTFLIGGLGAGKTELSLNLSVWNAKHFDNPIIVDLDIVNPFFRVRKLREQIENEGVKVVTPVKRVVSGDIPALPPGIWGAVSENTNTVVCDVGGGEPGLRLLGRLTELAEKRNAVVLAVLNPFRPGYETEEKLEESFNLITRLSSLKATQIIANPNLVGDTSLELFETGLARISKFSEKIGIPVGFAMAAEELASKLSPDTTFPNFFEFKGYKVFGFNRYWNNPWQFGILETTEQFA